MITSSTSDETIFPKAAPIITPTAKSTTLPRMANSLNSFSTGVLLYFFDEEMDGPERSPKLSRESSVPRIIVEARKKERREGGWTRSPGRVLAQAGLCLTAAVK